MDRHRRTRPGPLRRYHDLQGSSPGNARTPVSSCQSDHAPSANPGTRGELILAKALQLTDDADGLAKRNIDALFSGTKLTHYGLR